MPKNFQGDVTLFAFTVYFVWQAFARLRQGRRRQSDPNATATARLLPLWIAISLFGTAAITGVTLVLLLFGRLPSQ
jgi:hypothetical protein